MNDARGVRPSERLARLRHDDGKLGQRDHVVTHQAPVEVLAVEQLHDDEGRAVRHEAVVEHLDHVRALHGGSGGGLPPEAGGTDRVGRERVRHELHHDLGPEREVLGDPDRAHATAPERAHEAHDRTYLHAGGEVQRRRILRGVRKTATPQRRAQLSGAPAFTQSAMRSMSTDVKT